MWFLCNLEAKFSYKLTAAMSIYGKDTADLGTYNDDICFDEKINNVRDKVRVIPNDKLTNTQSLVSIKDGTRDIKNKHDLSDRIDQNILENKIVNKSASLLSKNKSHEISKILNSSSESKVASLVDCLVS